MKHDILINQTIDTLLLGGTILYPTDTIWGLGCDAHRADAVDKLYDIKERDRTKSMLVLCAEGTLQNSKFKIQNSPRPTTYILPKEIWHPLLGDSIAANLPAEDGSLGIRIPQHSFCQELIHRLGAPLVSTSANLSGYPSPNIYNDIAEELKQRVDFCVPPLEEFLSNETRGSRIVKIASDGTETIIRP